MEFYNDVNDDVWKKDLVVLLEDVRENPMQPFPPNSEIGSKNGAIIGHDDYHRETSFKVFSNGHHGGKAAKNGANGNQNDSQHENGNQQRNGNHQENGRHQGNGNHRGYGNRGGHGNYGGYGNPRGHGNGAPPPPPDRSNGHDEDEICAQRHRADSSKEVHKYAKVVNSETKSGTARGSSFFFRPGATFKVGVWEDKNRKNESSNFASFDLGEFVGRGILTLGDSLYVDSEAMNFDPFKKVDKVTEWRHEFDQIGKELV